MRLRIRHRLFAGFLGVVVLLVALIVVLVGSGLRRNLLEDSRDYLTRQLALGEWVVAASPSTDPDSLARELTRRVGYRVTFIRPDGVVLGDSYVARELLDDVENHADRPEVQGALRGEVSFAERTSATIGDHLLYAARVVDLDGSPVILRFAASLEELDRTVAQAQRTVAATGLLATLVALLVAYALSAALARPLVVLSDQARSLAQGDFEKRASRQSGIPELDDLATAFNRLADELGARLAELGRERDEMQTLIDCMAEGVIALTEDARILRTNRAARALLRLSEVPPYAPVGALVRNPELREVLEESVMRPVEAREITLDGRVILVSSSLLDLGGAVTTMLDISELRRLEEVRRDFVANASHELKTPLTAIHGFSETLLEDDTPEDLRRRFLESIRSNTDRLQRLVDDLLDLSRLESGGWLAQPTDLDLERVALEAWEAYRETAERRDVTLTSDAEVQVRGDRAGLVQIFRNLFENALRHTDEGGRIHVGARRADDGMVVVEVTDDGEGVPARALPRIFERFYRADSSRARDVGGTGLGLAIVRHMVGAMGGDVEAESELGRGTTIRFRLPQGGA